MIRKILWLLAAFLVVHVHLAGAQQPTKVQRIGYLSASVRAVHAPNFEAFQDGLRELGYVDGKNIIIEARFAEGQVGRLPELIAELVRLEVDVILAGGSEAVRPAKEAAKTIPIVVAHFEDPIGEGFVTSLARPGKHHRVKQDVERLDRQAVRAAERNGSRTSAGRYIRESVQCK